jgi:negative regulator of sigma E activity
MSLRPYDVTHDEVDLPPEINNILVNHGLAQETSATKIDPENKFKSAREIFKKNNADITDAAHTISSVMRGAEKESDRLRAADMVLKIHGVLQEEEINKLPTIIINIQGEANKTLVNLVLPTT